MKITLYYFKIPFWRAEVSRLALYIGDIPFKDYRIEGADRDKFKETLNTKQRRLNQTNKIITTGILSPLQYPAKHHALH